MVLHPATRRRLEETGLLDRLENNTSFVLTPRMGYTQFISLISCAEFVVTDGGSNQEELSYLGIPTLLMREATERQEGVGKTTVLCNYDTKIIDEFLENHEEMRAKGQITDDTKPSKGIVDHLSLLHIFAPFDPPPEGFLMGVKRQVTVVMLNLYELTITPCVSGEYDSAAASRHDRRPRTCRIINTEVCPILLENRMESAFGKHGTHPGIVHRA